MKKLLLLTVVLMLVISPIATLTVHAVESVDWEYGDNTYNFVADDATAPQLTGYFYFTDRSTNEIVFSPELRSSYYLHLIVGVVGEDPAENVKVQFEIDEDYSAYDVYRNHISIRATISADNYESVQVRGSTYFYYDDNCWIELSAPVQLVRDRSDSASGLTLEMDSLEDSFLVEITDGSIKPGTKNACEVIIPCIFSNDPVIFTEENQPPQTRFNAIANNPTIGNEAISSAWVTDEDGNLVGSLVAGYTYTAHLYVRVSGPEAATGTTIKSDVVDSRTIHYWDSWNLYARVRSNEARDFVHDVKYPVQTNLELHYIDGSLLLHREGQEDIALNPVTFFQDSSSTDGARIGTDGLDGTINPGLDSACEITYQFSTIDLDAKEAAKEAEKKAQEEQSMEEEAERGTTFSKECSAWITNESGNEVTYLAADNVYTVHESIIINGTESAEGVKISNSDLATLAFDEHAKSLYCKLVANDIESDTVVFNAQRSRNTDEILTLKFVNGSLQVKSAAGTYNLSKDDFFDFETGCLVGFSGADGIIPAGKEYAVEVTYQVKTVASTSKSKLDLSNLLRSPVVTVILIIIVIFEQFIVNWMAYHPDNRLSRRAERRRRFWKTVKDGFAKARADARSDIGASDDKS